MIAVKLSESESWIKLVTSNYCTCDLWTTLILGVKTFPIIEAFFSFLVLNSGPIQSSPSQYNIYSHTSSTYQSVEGHCWLVNWVTKTHPPSTPVENCHPKEAWLHNKCHKIYLSGPFGIFCLYVILTISYLRAQTIETSSLPTDSSRPLFKQIEIFSILTEWLFISTNQL